MAKKRKKRAWKRWTAKEKQKILRRYDKAPAGTKYCVLEEFGIHASHIYSWRCELEG